MSATATAGPETLRLDYKSPLPLHAQAELWLRALIQQPEYRTGELLPDEVSLARSLGISRNTLRAAIGRLVDEGRLERKAGVGSRVVEPKAVSGIGAWHSLATEREARGISVETCSLNVKWVSALPEPARALRIARGAKVLRLDRVCDWGALPEVDFRSYLHPRLGLARNEDFSRPLYQLIRERCGVFADQSLEELSAVSADRRLAERLAVAVGAPLLRRVQTVLDTGGRPVEFAVVHYRCDRFRLALNLRIEK